MADPAPRSDARIAVIGSSGQIGSALVASLQGRVGVAVQGFDVVAGPGVRILDISAPDAPGALAGFDVLFHLAARIPVDGAPPDPRGLTATNVLGLLQALEAARLHDARLIFLSSVSVYGDPAEVPVRETAAMRPLSHYGMSKMVGEQYVGYYRDLYGIDATVVRPFNVYSDRTATEPSAIEVVGRYVRSALASEPLVVSGDGQQTRDFVHVSDVVSFLGLLVTGRGKGETYNVGSGSPTTILELATWIRDALNPGLPLVHREPRSRDVRRSWADIERARSLGFEPRVRLRDWIASLPRLTHARSGSSAPSGAERGARGSGA